MKFESPENSEREKIITPENAASYEAARLQTYSKKGGAMKKLALALALVTVGGCAGVSYRAYHEISGWADVIKKITTRRTLTPQEEKESKEREREWYRQLGRDLGLRKD